VSAEKSGPEFVRAGLFRVGLRVQGDPAARWHWQTFKARSYEDAREKSGEQFRMLAHAAVGRIQEQVRKSELLISDLLVAYPHAPYWRARTDA
jgi:hypothetical protein